MTVVAEKSHDRPYAGYNTLVPSPRLSVPREAKDMSFSVRPESLNTSKYNMGGSPPDKRIADNVQDGIPAYPCWFF